jgi:hypothetical protein
MQVEKSGKKTCLFNIPAKKNSMLKMDEIH